MIVKKKETKGIAIVYLKPYTTSTLGHKIHNRSLYSQRKLNSSKGKKTRFTKVDLYSQSKIKNSRKRMKEERKEERKMKTKVGEIEGGKK